MKQPRLENWSITHNDSLCGEVFDDSRFKDGTVVYTSRVVRLDKETGKAYTKNTEYLLGVPYDERKSSN